jgi:hypothetical protein
MKPTGLLDMYMDDDDDNLRYWHSGNAGGSWTSPTSDHGHSPVKIVTLEDTELVGNHNKLIKKHEILEKEVKELREFKKEASVLRKLLDEIKKNTPSVQIARLVRRIGVG